MACVDLLPIVNQDVLEDSNDRKPAKRHSLKTILSGIRSSLPAKEQKGDENGSSNLDRFEFMDKFAEIRNDIKEIDNESLKIDDLSHKVDLCDNGKDKMKLIDECNNTIHNTIKLNNQLRDKIKNLKANDNSNEIEMQWFENEMNYCHQTFYQTQLAFSQSINKFNVKFADYTKRNVNVYFGNGSNCRNNTVLNNDNLQTILNDPLKSVGFIDMSMQLQLNDENESKNVNEACDEFLDQLSKMELKHNHMLEIEASMKELCQLWNEFAYLMDAQQVYIDSIHDRVLDAKKATEKGTDNLVDAEKDQKKIRKMQGATLFTVVVVAAVVVIILV